MDSGCGRNHAGRHRHHHHGGSCACGCGSPGHFRRRFRSREEIVTDLERYLEDLRQEVVAVEERIAELKGKQ